MLLLAAVPMPLFWALDRTLDTIHYDDLEENVAFHKAFLPGRASAPERNKAVSAA